MLLVNNMNDKPSLKQVETYADFWFKSSIDNLETAESLFRSKRYNFSMFMCQQTIEAILKCAFVKIKRDRPPFLHKLPKLLISTGLKVPTWVDKTILTVDAHYIKARYFEDRFNCRIYNRKNALQLLNDTRRALKWFIQELELKK